jgi:diguanylate cyclase (GGDEF)-like protein
MLNNNQEIMTVIQGIPAAVFVIDADHIVRYWNAACETISGIPADQIVGTRDAWRAFYSEQRPLLADVVIEAARDSLVSKLYNGKYRPSMFVNGAYEVEDYFPNMRGGAWMLFTAAPLRDENDKIIGAIEVLQDITDKKRAELAQRESEKRLGEIIQGSPVPTFVIDAEHRVTQWNKACEAIIGASAAEMVGTKQQWKAFYPNERPVLADLVLDGGDEGAIGSLYGGHYRPSAVIEGAYEAEGWFPHFPRGGRWLFFTAAPLHDSEGKVVGAVETLQDITERKRYEEELRHSANHDALTGLVNRRLLIDRLDHAIACAKRDVSGVAVLFIDLDNFKGVNDTLGHEAGDMLVRQVAERLTDSLRDMDTIARLGGDEFVVLAYGHLDDNAVTRVMTRIQSYLTKPFDIGGAELYISCSIGAALYPRDGQDTGALLKNADAAMYRAKEMGRAGFQFFREEINVRVTERMALERDLRAAIAGGELQVHYQPQIDIVTGRIVGAEALLRWNSASRGMVSPVKFIPVAEDSGLIVPLGKWVLEQSCADCKQWINDGWPEARISVNLSARQFRHANLTEHVAELCRGFASDRLHLELEITESMVMADPERAVEMMRRFKGIGVHLALDDFGTGYSSLSQLRHLPLDIIKVDRAFVMDIGVHDDGEALISAIITMARVLGKKVVAEGVENVRQLDFLRAQGCHEYQGFLFSPAVPAARFAELLRENHAATRHRAIEER